MSTWLRMLCGIDVEVAEEADDRAQLADAALVEQLAQAQPLRMAAHHEGLADLDAGAGAHRQQRLRFRGGQADRLLAEHMLARLGGLDGPGNMEMVGQRIVDGVDVGVGQQLFVGAVGGGNAERGRGLLRLGQIARGDGNDGGMFALLHAGDHFFQANVGGAEDSPANLVGHRG